MIVLPHQHWLRLLFAWRGSVLLRILPRLILIALLSVLAVLMFPWWSSHFGNSSLTVSAFTLMGITLAIFLGFRNSVSYDRYWEGRKLWGALLNAARSISRQMLSFSHHQDISEARRQFVLGVAAFPTAVAHQLRQSDASAEFARLLPEEVVERLARANNKPQIILLWLGKMANALQQQGRISDLQLQALEKQLCALSDAQGGCERIAYSPIPFTYRVLLARTVTIYSLLLPFALAGSIGWMTPVIATFIAYTFIALEAIGEEIEEPFGFDPNDLPLYTLSYNIEAALHELLQEPMRVSAPPSRRYHLL